MKRKTKLLDYSLQTKDFKVSEKKLEEGHAF